MNESSCVKPPRKFGIHSSSSTKAIHKLMITRLIFSLNNMRNQDYFSKNHVRKFLRDLPLKWRAKVTTIEEAKDLAKLPLDKLIGNLKVYEMIFENDGFAFKTTKEKVKYLALKDKELLKVLPKRQSIRQQANRFGRGRGNNFGNKGGERSRQKQGCYNCEEEGHFISECLKPQENKAFVGGAWNDSKEGNKPQNDSTCLMEINSQEVDSLKCNVSRLQNKALNFSKFKKSIVVLDDMLSRQKLPQDKKGLGFSKNNKTTSVSLNKPITFVEEGQNEAPGNPSPDALGEALARHQCASRL
ncbi:protein CHUP1, chloroplastic [Tanacetum coccineum]